MHGTRCRVGIGVRRLAASVVLLGFAGSAHAERLPIKAYTVESGLAHNRVKRIVQDSHAFLWFCTAAGLSRFDGYQFTNYTTENGLPSLSINDLVEGEDGVYWIATNSDGVIRFDLRAAVPSNDEAFDAVHGLLRQRRTRHQPRECALPRCRRPPLGGHRRRAVPNA